MNEKEIIDIFRKHAFIYYEVSKKRLHFERFLPANLKAMVELYEDIKNLNYVILMDYYTGLIDKNEHGNILTIDLIPR